MCMYVRFLAVVGWMRLPRCCDYLQKDKKDKKVVATLHSLGPHVVASVFPSGEHTLTLHTFPPN
jgi:hypothetical protein